MGRGAVQYTDVHERFEGNCCLLDKIVNYLSTLKMKAVRFYETLITIYPDYTASRRGIE